MTVSESVFENVGQIKWSHCACMIAGVLIATLVRFPFQPAIQDASPFLFYIPVVVAVAIIFGKRLGLYATMLSVLPANYFWMPPDNAFEMNLNDVWRILGFSLAGFSVSYMSDEVRKHKQLEIHLRETLASMEDAIVTTDCRGRILYQNAAVQVLTEMNDQDLTGCMIGSALNLVSKDGGHQLGGSFQMAIINDEIENLPSQIILTSQTGRKHPVVQKISRILDARGKRLGTVILFRRSESSAKAVQTLTAPSSAE